MNSGSEGWKRGPGDIAAQIVMERTAYEGSFLLVEGVDDVKFWQPRVVKDECEMIDCQGKLMVIAAIEKLKLHPVLGVLGVVDDDFDAIETSAHSESVLATDDHDLETQLLRSSAFERVLAEFGDRTKIKRFETAEGMPLREALFQRGMAFGRLRWASHRYGWLLNFERLKPSKFISVDEWAVNEEALYEEAFRCVEDAAAGVRKRADELPAEEAEVLRKSAEAFPSDVQALRTQVDALPDAEPRLVCQGHDLIKVLVVGLRKVLGSNPKKNPPTPNGLAGVLRSGLERTELETWPLCSRIRTWQSLNPPYVIIPSP